MFVWQKGVHHARESPASLSAPEVRVDAVRMVRELGASLQEVADVVGCSVETVRNWSSRPSVTPGCAPTG